MINAGRPGRLTTALFLCAMLAACGITAPRHSAGFAELESPGLVDTDLTMTLSIGPTLLNFAAKHIDDDPEMERLLRSLDGVRIRIYQIDGDPARVATRLRRMSTHLQADGWEPVLLVRDPQEEVQMLLKTRDGSIRGLTVLSADDEAEVVVINLMGEIQPQRFADVMLALEVDAPAVQNIEVADALN